jgi:PBSX family phage terminase large subunit
MVWQPLPANCKAAEVWLEFVDDQDTKYFFLEGAVRSSKTFGSIIAWADYVQNFAPPGPIIMMGNTYTTLKQNVIYPLIELVGPKDAKLKSAATELELFGRTIYLFGAPNIQAMFKLQGKGAVAAYCDEANTYPYDVWQMLGTRTAAEGIKILATFNPGSPRSWMKVEYLDRLKEVNGRAWHFSLDDNPFLSEKVKNELKSQYTGLWRKRYIDGLWVVAEGSIYPDYEDAKVSQIPKEFDKYLVTCDYGTTNPFVYLMLGRSNGIWYVIKEFYHDSNVSGRRVNKQQSEELKKFLGGIIPHNVEVDPSAAAFIEQLRQDYPELADRGIIIPAINTVLTGIQHTAQMMYQGKLKIYDKCVKTLDEMAGYTWDSKSTEKGEDVPIKVNDHAMDCLRYAVNRISWDGL